MPSSRSVKKEEEDESIKIVVENEVKKLSGCQSGLIKPDLCSIAMEDPSL